MSHEIFRTPNPVNLSLEEQPLPSEYDGKNGSGDDLPDPMPMWRVQTTGDHDPSVARSDFFLGLVSDPRGFLDSPDTEVISGGGNSKRADAIAIGRHGNYFHWGFAASPTHLTESAQLVLVNAIHYISKFDGRGVVARKKKGTVLRETLEADVEMAMGARWVDAPNHSDRLRLLKRYVSESQWVALGGDADRVIDYLRENGTYLYPSGWYELTVDQDLRALSLPNNSPDFIEQLRNRIDDPEESVRARRVLERYTSRDLDELDQWRRWIDANRQRLFFSEAAGYQWLVDERLEVSSPDLNPSPTAPLAWSCTAVRRSRETIDLRIDVEMLDGWHCYDNVPAGKPYTPLTIDLALPDGVEVVGELTRPISRPNDQAPRLLEWVGSIRFSATLRAEEGAADSDLGECSLTYQVCDEFTCRPRTTERKPIRFGSASR